MTNIQTNTTIQTELSKACCQIAAASVLLALFACGTGPVILNAQAGAGGSPPRAGAGGTAADGGSPVLCALDGGDAEFDPASYDRSCQADSDCVSVPQGNVCYACVRSCTGGALNRGAEAQYRADIQKVVPVGEPNAVCHCPAEFAPCCLNHQCHSGPECQTGM